jgi:hypothetical protein
MAANLALLEENDQARAFLRTVPAIERTGDYFVVAARLEDPAEVEAALERAEARWPKDTLVHSQYGPLARAILALRRGDPKGALTHLEGAALVWPRDMELPYEKGRALLALKDARGAEAAFRTVLAEPGLGPDPTYNLARLGLARALALGGEIAASRQAYEAFFASWKDADPGLGILVKAKAEYVALKHA